MTLNVFNYITHHLNNMECFLLLNTCMYMRCQSRWSSLSAFFCKKVSKIFAQLLYNSNSRNLAKKKTDNLAICTSVSHNMCESSISLSYSLQCFLHNNGFIMPSMFYTCLHYIRQVSQGHSFASCLVWMNDAQNAAVQQPNRKKCNYVPICLLSVYFVKTTFEILKLNSVHSTPYE